MRNLQVLSHQNAWANLNSRYSKQLKDVLDFLEQIRDPDSDALMTSHLFSRGWAVTNNSLWLNSKDFNNPDFGASLDGVAFRGLSGSPTNIYRWLDTHHHQSVSNMPPIELWILLIVDQRITQRSPLQGTYFDMSAKIVSSLALSTLAMAPPFCIIGVSCDTDFNFQNPEIIETQVPPNTDSTIVLERIIEFTPEHFLAGVGILNYFSVFVRENYGQEQAVVKIEQSGLTVRLVIETSTGERTTIEKALSDYREVIMGTASPENIANNMKVLLDLKNELRISELRIQSQSEIMAVQNSQIERLTTIIGKGLEVQATRPFTINVSAKAVNTVSFQLPEELTKIQDLLQEMRANHRLDPAAEHTVDDLKSELEELKAINPEPTFVRKLPVMAKLKNFLEIIKQATDCTDNAVLSLEKAKRTTVLLAEGYNRIASWCGLPEIPFI